MIMFFAGCGVLVSFALYLLRDGDSYDFTFTCYAVRDDESGAWRFKPLAESDAGAWAQHYTSQGKRVHSCEMFAKIRS